MAFLKRSIKILLVSKIMLLLVSCGTLQLDNAYLPQSSTFEPKLIISGMLLAETPLRNIFIGRSLPLQAETSIKGYSVFDAKAVVAVDGKEFSMSLQHDSTKPRELPGSPSDYSFYEVPGLMIQSGKSYQITVTWRQGDQDNLAARAVTDVPAEVPNLDSVSIERIPRKSVNYHAFIRSNNVLQAYTLVVRAEKIGSPQHRRLSIPVDGPILPGAGGAGVLTKLSSRIDISPTTPQFFDLIDSTGKSANYPTFARFYVYDKVYAQYFRSGLSALQSNSNPFSSGNIENIQGNVVGNGLGIFCGLKIGAESQIRVR